MSKICRNQDSDNYKKTTLSFESCKNFYPRLNNEVYALTKQKESDNNNVNHPNHYNIGNIEVIDFIESWELNFSLGNAIKYIARAPYKGKELEDLKKAKWYLEREIDRLENNTNK